MSGKFVVVEGLEGAGKSTAICTVKQVLTELVGAEMIDTREPGGTPLGEALRQLVKHPNFKEPVCREAELLMIYASRVQLVEQVIKPALERGCWVIGDRHDLSSHAYQGGGRGIDLKQIQALRDMVLGDFYPDLTLYLDIEPSVGLERARSRGELDRIEQEAIDFFHRSRATYLQKAAENEQIITIDAMQPLAAVQQDIRQALSQWLTGSR